MLYVTYVTFCFIVYSYIFVIYIFLSCVGFSDSRKRTISHDENFNKLHDELLHDDMDSNDLTPSTSKKSRSKITFYEKEINVRGKRKGKSK